MRPGQGPATRARAELQLAAAHVVHVVGTLPVLELAHVVVVAAEIRLGPAEEDVAHRLQQALTLHHTSS